MCTAMDSFRARTTPRRRSGNQQSKCKGKGGDTQTGYVLALHMNLLPERLRAAAAQKLVDKIEENHGLLAPDFWVLLIFLRN